MEERRRELWGFIREAIEANGGENPPEELTPEVAEMTLSSFGLDERDMPDFEFDLQTDLDADLRQFNPEETIGEILAYLAEIRDADERAEEEEG